MTNDELCAAASTGDLPGVNRMLNSGICSQLDLNDALLAAAAAGNLEIVTSLVQRGAAVEAGDNAALIEAASRGHLEVMRYVHGVGGDIRAGGDSALRDGAASGHLDVVEYLHQNGVNIRAAGQSALRGAACNGHVSVVMYLHTNGVDIHAGDDEALRAAASNGHLGVVEYLHASGGDLRAGEEAALRGAALGGYLGVVRYLHENGADIRAGEDEPLRGAAANGHLDVVRYLHEYGADAAARSGEALSLTSAGQHADVVRYLHRSGVEQNLLSAEGRVWIERMRGELASAPEIYRPSKFWEEMNRDHTTLLGFGGEPHFKRTVNQAYFNFVPSSPWDPKIVNLAKLWLRRGMPSLARYEIDDPDCDPGLWLSWIEDYSIFKDDRERRLKLYKRYVASLHEYVLRSDREGVLAQLEEPELGNPIRIRRDGRMISQDLANSVRERNAIVDALDVSYTQSEPGRDRPPLIAELGAGYGRLGHVLLATSACRYVVFDIPPALYVSQWYLSRLFSDRRIFKFRPFSSYAEVAEELEQADLAFLTPNQLEMFPDGYFVACATVSSLHEMRREQIAHYLGLMAAKTRNVIYIKQRRRYVNPHDGLRIRRSAYKLRAPWRVVMRRSDALNPGFFERAWAR